MNITASWIWPADSDGRGFNLCSVFRRDFRLESVPASARILITADSYYRLKINGQVKGVLEENKAERHIRGGIATRKKYKGA